MIKTKQQLNSSLWPSTCSLIKGYTNIHRAYEVLSDERKRWEYDRFEYPLLSGAMPDGYEPHASMAPNGHTFVWESSFDSARRAQGRNGPDAFSRAAFDPFELFNSMFSRDFHEMEASYGLDDSFNAMNDWHGMSTSTFGRPTSFGAPPPGFMREPILGMPMHHDAPFGGVGLSPFGLMSGLSPMHTSAPGQSSFSSSMSSLSFNGGNTGGTSETRRTTVVNGRRETTITKRDEHGNETVRRISPDGETVYVNGQIQSSIEAPQPKAVEMASGNTESASKDSRSGESSGSSSSRRKMWKLFGR